MSEPSACVYVDLEGIPRLAGRLWTNVRNERESAIFEYDESWIEFEGRFSLEPALRVGPGPFYTAEGRSIFSALGDSAPDRWGRTLLARQERLSAKSEGRQPRTLRELDYLLGISDLTRAGALRFSLDEGGSFVADDGIGFVPPLVDLPRLLSATERVLAETEDAEDLRILLAPGSSLGGARPKASVRDRNGRLMIAKFPAESDSYDVVRWESVALELAGRAGIETAKWRLEHVGGREALLVERFDRGDGTRTPFLSAISMLDAREGENRSYTEIADSLKGPPITLLLLVEPEDAERVRYAPPPPDSLGPVPEWVDQYERYPMGRLSNSIPIHVGRPGGRPATLPEGMPDTARVLTEQGVAFLESHDAEKDRLRAMDVIRTDRDWINRSIAAAVLTNFPEEDSTWWALADVVRGIGPHDYGRDEGFIALNMLGAVAARPVDWAPAAETLRAILDGTNLFAIEPLMGVLTKTKISPELADDVLGDGRYVLAYLRSPYPLVRSPAVQFLRQISGLDFGNDADRWEEWILSLEVEDGTLHESGPGRHVNGSRGIPRRVFGGTAGADHVR